MIAVIIATVVQSLVVNLINDAGSPIGVSASVGGHFLAFTWVSWVLTVVSTVAWAVAGSISMAVRERWM